MSNFIQNDLFIFSVTTVALLLLAIGYILYQKIMYDKFIKELTIKHGFDKPSIPAVAEFGINTDLPPPEQVKDWFLNYEYESYQFFKNLPIIGIDKTLYFVRETGQHYIWSGYDYRNLCFVVKDEVDYQQEITFHYTDGTSASYSVKVDRKSRFAYSKLLKWFVLESSEKFNFRIKNGFVIILRSTIKQISYRYK